MARKASSPTERREVAYEVAHAIAEHGAERLFREQLTRGQEFEADYIGLVLMTRAQYNPTKSIAFWERMDSAGSRASESEYLSTHPSGSTRVRQIRRWLPQVRRDARSEPVGQELEEPAS